MTRKLPPAVARTTTPASAAQHTPRNYARASVDLAAEYSVDGRSDWLACTIDVLGGGGVRLQTAEDLASGTVIALRFTVAQTAVAANGRITMSMFDRSRERYVHGVAFTAIEPRAQQAIVERVAALDAQAGD